MSDLYRLVYASRNLLRMEDADLAATVAQILATSKANNARVQVTGALMFNGGAFAQVLEGPRHGVEETFERIQRDARHGDVTVLECGPVPARSFPNWSMAFVGDSARGRRLWAGLAGQSGFEMSRLDGEAVFRMLHGLVLEEEGIEVGHPVEIPALPAPEVSVVEPVAEAHETGLDAPSPEEPALAVLRRALALERQRTTDLRNEIDDLRIALLQERARHDAGSRERDLWVERARCLAATLCREADAVRRGSTVEASRQAA